MYYKVKSQFNNIENKKVIEEFLVDAESVTEAEAKVVNEKSSGVDDFEVTSVTITKIVEVL